MPVCLFLLNENLHRQIGRKKERPEEIGGQDEKVDFESGSDIYRTYDRP